jgi:Zn-dependent protease with chaperone function
MKFVPRDMGGAAEASNPGPGGLRREIAFLLLASAALLVALYLSVGWMVELALPRISVEREKTWFSGFSLGVRSVEPASPLETQRFATARDVLSRLRAAPGVPALEYKLVLVDDSAPNAFALPGGTIGITRGMLALLDDEIALAFVLGHELGHFAQRDHLRRMGRAAGRALVWSVVFGDASDLLTRHAGELLELAHSRRQESGADVFGLELVHTVYGRTAGAERLFEWLDERQRLPAWTRWLHTHPHPGDRVQHLREVLSRHKADESVQRNRQ